MSKKKSRTKTVESKKDSSVFTIKVDQTKRKMPPEELQLFLRESKRGTGVQQILSHKQKRKQAKQALRRWKWGKPSKASQL